MESGYEPKTDICWSFGNKGDNSSHNKNSHYHCRCPACIASHLRGEKRLGQYETALFGRCRSGKRWFWSARKFSEEAVFGWTDTEEQATAAVMDAVRSLKTAPFMKAISRHECARDVLKEINEAKRRERPAPVTSDARITEYLYTRHGYKFRITKKAKKRVFYCREPLPIEEREDIGIRSLAHADEIGVVDRQKLEQEGEVYNPGFPRWNGRSGQRPRKRWRNRGFLLSPVGSVRTRLSDPVLELDLTTEIDARSWPDTISSGESGIILAHCWSDDFHLYRVPPSLREEEPLPDLRELKAAMAAVHPDRGGSSEAFIEARARYEAARRSDRARNAVA